MSFFSFFYHHWVVFAISASLLSSLVSPLFSRQSSDANIVLKHSFLPLFAFFIPFYLHWSSACYQRKDELCDREKEREKDCQAKQRDRQLALWKSPRNEKKKNRMRETHANTSLSGQNVFHVSHCALCFFFLLTTDIINDDEKGNKRIWKLFCVFSRCFPRKVIEQKNEPLWLLFCLLSFSSWLCLLYFFSCFYLHSHVALAVLLFLPSFSCWWRRRWWCITRTKGTKIRCLTMISARVTCFPGLYLLKMNISKIFFNLTRVVMYHLEIQRDRNERETKRQERERERETFRGWTRRKTIEKAFKRQREKCSLS